MRDCRAELCPYWPGEGCMRGVMPCADEVECPESKMDSGSHSVLFYDGERCDWCYEKEPTP